MKKKTKVT